MSILNHHEWPLLLYCLVPEFVLRDPRPHDLPRNRVEGRPGLPDAIVEHLLTLRTPCVHCGELMAPIRKRDSGRIYWASSCAREQHDKDRCSKGRAAREEYIRVRDALMEVIRHEPPPPRESATEVPLPF